MRPQTRISERWLVHGAFAQGNSRNYSLFIVEDGDVPSRFALLKTVRKTDLPSASLYKGRRRALDAEIERLGRLTSPHLPEPLDVVTLSKDDKAIVYALLDQASGTFTLRELVQRWGFFNDTKAPRCRDLPRIADYMFNVAGFTEELWQLGFVHVNLCPDHVLSLKDNLLRIVGTSGICERAGHTICADDPGLRNVTIGYQSSAHYTRITGMNRDPMDASRVRWRSYAVLALDLIWGRDVRDYCSATGTNTLTMDASIEAALWKDCESVMEQSYRGATDPTFAITLRRLLGLIYLCLQQSEDALPDDTLQQFLEQWTVLRDCYPRDNHLLRLPADEMAWRRSKGWEYKLYDAPRKHTDKSPLPWSEKRDKPWTIGQEGDFLICGSEQVQSYSDGQGKPRERLCYEVVNLAFPAKRRHDQGGRLTSSLSVMPHQNCFFQPGDIVRGEYKKLQEYAAPDVHLAGWEAISDFTPRHGDPLRGLSLGYVQRKAKGFPPFARPWALVDFEGRILAFPILPSANDRKYTVFPRAGRFFAAQFVERKSTHSSREQGVVLLDEPSLASIKGFRGEADVRDISNDGQNIFFDLTFQEADEFFTVTCAILRSGCDLESVTVGQRIAIRVDSVDHLSIRTSWDAEHSRQHAAIGEVYSGKLVARLGSRRALFIFGRGEIFRGSIDLKAQHVPWGLPFGRWRTGERLSVKVRGLSDLGNGKTEYVLEYAGAAPTRSVEETYRIGLEYAATVLSHLDHGLLVLLKDSAETDATETVGVVQKWGLGGKAITEMAVGSSITVRVTNVNSQNRRIALALVDK